MTLPHYTMNNADESVSDTIASKPDASTFQDRVAAALKYEKNPAAEGTESGDHDLEEALGGLRVADLESLASELSVAYPASSKKGTLVRLIRSAGVECGAFSWLDGKTLVLSLIHI